MDYVSYLRIQQVLASPKLRSYQKELALKSQGVETGISPALAVAQRRLDELRQQHQCTCQNTGHTTSLAHGREQTAQEKPSRRSISLPGHLGWHNPAVTQLLHRAMQDRTRILPVPATPSQPSLPRPVAPVRQPVTTNLSTTRNKIKLHPDLALAMLRQGQAAAGRIWLLLRHMDPQGKGWIEVSAARQALTANTGSLRVCGWRQLRNLLAQGEGLFWRRRDERIWLIATTKVAAGLGVQRLSAHPVTLPVSVLCAPIGDVRAHFYASFHSSRSSGQQLLPVRPIARATLEKLTKTSRHTLRAYERRAGVSRQTNFAIGPSIQNGQEQEQAWQRGRALFQFTDHRGLLGRPKVTYSAWQLPNSYRGPHERLPRGSQKQLNQQLADLSMKGMTGNGEGKGQRSVSGPSLGGAWITGSKNQRLRRFFDSGAAAARNYCKSSQSDLYWPKQQIRQSEYRIWHLLPGSLEASR